MLTSKQVQSLKPKPFNSHGKRGYYTTSELNRMFPDQKRNKTIDELFRGSTNEKS